MTTLHVDVHRITRQTVLPEARLKSWFEVGLVPHVGMQVAPLLHEGVEVGLIDGESLGIGLGDKLRLAGNRPHVLGILRLAKTHIVVAAHRVTERLVIHVGSNVEVHAAAYILHHQTIAPGCSALEVDVPHVGSDERLLSSLLYCVGGTLPELHHAGGLLLLRLYII